MLSHRNPHRRSRFLLLATLTAVALLAVATPKAKADPLLDNSCAVKLNLANLAARLQDLIRKGIVENSPALSNYLALSTNISYRMGTNAPGTPPEDMTSNDDYIDFALEASFKVIGIQLPVSVTFHFSVAIFENYVWAPGTTYQCPYNIWNDGLGPLTMTLTEDDFPGVFVDDFWVDPQNLPTAAYVALEQALGEMGFNDSDTDGDGEIDAYGICGVQQHVNDTINSSLGMVIEFQNGGETQTVSFRQIVRDSGGVRVDDAKGAIYFLIPPVNLLGGDSGCTHDHIQDDWYDELTHGSVASLLSNVVDAPKVFNAELAISPDATPLGLYVVCDHRMDCEANGWLDQDEDGFCDTADLDGDGQIDFWDYCPTTLTGVNCENDGDGYGEGAPSMWVLCAGLFTQPDTEANRRLRQRLCGGCDNCQGNWNLMQVDTDQDGLGDECDDCAYTGGPDTDNDGVPSICDNCPLIYNPDQEDTDRDGLGDACDNCPSVSNADQANWNNLDETTDPSQEVEGDACDDSDSDGVVDLYDCERLNSELRWDLDNDGVCDRYVGFDEVACIAACGANPTTQCIEACQGTDNCPCIDPATCPTTGAPASEDYEHDVQFYQQYCEAFISCVQSGAPNCGSTPAADVCFAVFANPTQYDGNQNGRGDRCESTTRAHVVRFEPEQRFHVDGYRICTEGGSYYVDVQVEGGSADMDGNGEIVWTAVPQRTAVGACGCTTDEIAQDNCDTTQTCPEDSEYDLNGDLAWEAIQADEATWKPNVGDVYACPSCQPYIDSDEPRAANTPNFRQHAINKYQKFSHVEQHNLTSFYWQWAVPGYQYQRRPLDKLTVRTRVAWQSPALTSYAYRPLGAPPEDWKIAYSDRVVMHADGGCHELPYEYNWWANGVLVNIVDLVEKPWDIVTNGPGADIGPWLVLGDVKTEDHYVVGYSGSGMQPATVERMSLVGGGEKALTEIGSATASGMINKELIDGQQLPSPTIFRYGGYNRSEESGLEHTGTLWLGFPTQEGNRWVKAGQDVYGVEAGKGPPMHEPRMVYHARGERLVVVGDMVVVRKDGTYSIEPAQIWTFDIQRGVWSKVGDWSGESTEHLTMNLDPMRNRAILLGHRDAKLTVYSLDLATLAITELSTLECDRLPAGLISAGTYLEPMEQALYVYGGKRYQDGEHSLDAFRLDLISRQWTYLGSGEEGPGARMKPYVAYDRGRSTLWVVGGDVESSDEAGLVMWGLRQGEWTTHATLTQK